MSLISLLQNLIVHFVDVAREQIQTGHNGTIRSELVFVHNFFMVVKISDIEVGGVRSE